MKTRLSRRQTAKVSHSRWLAYATASAATALAGSHSAEAAIHYSGILNVTFPPHNDYAKTFPLDHAGDFISFERAETNTGYLGGTDIAYFRIFGIASAAFRGFRSTTSDNRRYVSKLPLGERISHGFFTVQPLHPSEGGIMAIGNLPFGSQEWKDYGTGYVGFRFNNGTGSQYGWARVKATGHPENGFKVLEYAYADPGEQIRAGQKSDNEMVTDEGSLGWLALGAVGLLAWRKSRSRTAS